MRKPTSGSFASLASSQNKRLRAENDSLRRDKQRLEKSLEIANSRITELEKSLSDAESTVIDVSISAAVAERELAEQVPVVNIEIDGADMDCVRDRTCRSDEYCEGYVDGMLDAEQQIKSQLAGE